MLRAEVEALLGAPLEVRSIGMPPLVGDTEAWYLPPPELSPVDSPYGPGAIKVTFTPEDRVASKLLNPHCRQGRASRANRSPG